MTDLLWGIGLSTVLVGVLLISNAAFRRGVPFYVSRKIAHFGAAIPLGSLPAIYDSVVYPLVLTGLFGLILLATHNYDVWPGFARAGRWSELWFPTAIMLSIAVFWRIDPVVAIVPGLWLALGDGITGLVRMVTVGREKKGWWGTVACLMVCSAIGLLVSPVIVGILGGAAATLAERYCGDAEGAILKIDDNIAMPVAGMAVMYPLLVLI